MALTYITRIFGGTILVDIQPGPPPSTYVPTLLPLYPFMGHYSGSGNYPLTPPFVTYAVNGVALSSQPYIVTAPLQRAGNVLPSGNTFLLLFTDPTDATKNALVDGIHLVLTFGLVGGTIATGLVQITSTLTGTLFQVFVTTLTDISLGS